MAPKAPGVPDDFRPPHGAVALTVPTVTDRTLFYGSCRRGDFVSPTHRVTKDEAEADVAEHLAEVAAHPHRPLVRILRGSTPQFLGTCDVGDFIATGPRSTWAEAAGDVAGHIAEMHPTQDES